MGLKKITISVKYEEEGTDIGHSISVKMEVDKPIGEIVQEAENFKAKMSGQHSLPIDQEIDRTLPSGI